MLQVTRPPSKALSVDQLLQMIKVRAVPFARRFKFDPDDVVSACNEMVPKFQADYAHIAEDPKQYSSVFKKAIANKLNDLHRQRCAEQKGLVAYAGHKIKELEDLAPLEKIVEDEHASELGLSRDDIGMRLLHMKAQMVAAVSPEDVGEIMKMLVTKAKAGSPSAARTVFNALGLAARRK